VVHKIAAELARLRCTNLNPLAEAQNAVQHTDAMAATQSLTHSAFLFCSVDLLK
jgi:hypothetical protein